MPETLVSVKGLHKTFKRADGSEVQAVRGIDLEIYRGEIFSMLGPNGAGKTTTISMISGLLTPTQGDATIGGHSITRAPMQAKRLLGVVPQEIALYPTLSARQNLEFFGRMYGMHGRELSQSVDEVLAFTDLKERAKDRVETFSGGMKRRVNIGVGLLHKPQLVYMDEPTVGVDPQSRRRILDTVMRLREERKMTVLYTTHLMEEAQELSNRVAIVDQGQIVALGTVGELIQQVGEEDRLILSLGSQRVQEDLLAGLRRIEGINRTQYEAAQPAKEGDDQARPATITIFAKRGRRALPQVISQINEAGLEIASVEVREPDLEAVFLHLTGRALRE